MKFGIRLDFEIIVATDKRIKTLIDAVIRLHKQYITDISTSF
jgi:hypothetical protein